MNTQPLRSRTITWQVLIGLGLLWLSSMLHAATLTATVDRTTISSNETFTLTLQIDTRSALGQPDLSLLEPYFEILGTSKSTQVSIVNGNASSSTQWAISLAPKVSGRILIPPFEFDGARSQPLQIEVTAASNSSADPAGDYYLELDSDVSQAYVDQQIKVSIRLYSAIRLSNLEAQPLQLDNAEVVKLDDQQYQKVQNGRRFLVYELNYAVFPRRPGALEIPAQRFNAIKDAARSLFDSRRGLQIRLATQPQSINILSAPSQVSPRDWLPAESISLTQTLSQPDGEYRVGEPITRTLTLRAAGIESDRLPPLKPATGSAFKSYPEPAELDQQTPASGIQTSRSERYGLVPTQTGRLELPAVELVWWDTTSNQPRVARVEAQSINVLPPLNAPAAQLPPVVTTPLQQLNTPLPVQFVEVESKWLLWTNLAWATLCLILVGIWWRARNKTAQTAASELPLQVVNQDEVQAFHALEKACQQNEPVVIRQALTAWRQLAGDSVTDESLRELSEQLDRGLYAQQANAETFDSLALLTVVRGCRQRASADDVNSGLPPLYR
ncbi:MAG: BatD family protein [Halopseudomonas sp.]